MAAFQQIQTLMAPDLCGGFPEIIGDVDKRFAISVDLSADKRP
jgi:hypothetical protein